MGPKEFPDKLEALDVESFASLLRFDYTHDDTVKAFRARNIGLPLKIEGRVCIYPAKPLVSYPINRQLSWFLPPLLIRAFGAHYQ